MKLGIALSLVSLSACATTSSTLEPREAAPHASVQLEFPASPDTQAVFPSAIEPRLPSVDRMSHQVRARLGDEVVAKLELCVSPEGRVTKAALLEGTDYEPLDQAIVRDAETWQFASMPGHTSTAALQTCEHATVRYLTPR